MSTDTRSDRAKAWAKAAVGDPAPCQLCGRPALMRDPDTRQPCHLLCAKAKASADGEEW